MVAQAATFTQRWQSQMNAAAAGLTVRYFLWAPAIGWRCKKCPTAGYEIKGLWISGIQRSLSLSNLAFPFKLTKSLMDAAAIVKKFQPDIAVGTGGYASGPLLFAATQKGIPALIQEQNSYAGVTNKLLGKRVDKICVSSDGMQKFFPVEKTIKTGNPVRQDLLNIAGSRDEAIDFFNLDSEKKTLLILGGSLGARRINQLLENQLDNLKKDVQIIWQCGSTHYEVFKKYDQNGVQVHKYLERMDLAYAAADFVISRAGAGTISELCVVGKPVILIPSPHVAENHQVKNAEAIAAQNAALMIEEKNLAGMFMSVWEKVLNNADLQKKLAANIRQLARPNATKDIVDIIKKLIHD